MYIYTIGTENQQKIGVSSNPIERLKTLQTGNGEALKLHYFFEVDESIAFKFEKHIHRENNHKRAKGEWFNMTPSEAKNLLVFYEMTSESISVML